MRSLIKPHKEALFVIPGLIRHPALLDFRFRENDGNGVLLMNSLVTPPFLKGDIGNY
jgi:hypothetical protein